MNYYLNLTNNNEEDKIMKTKRGYIKCVYLYVCSCCIIIFFTTGYYYNDIIIIIIFIIVRHTS